MKKLLQGITKANRGEKRLSPNLFHSHKTLSATLNNVSTSADLWSSTWVNPRSPNADLQNSNTELKDSSKHVPKKMLLK